MRHPDDNIPDNAPYELIMATGGLSDISRWEYFADLKARRTAPEFERRSTIAEIAAIATHGPQKTFERRWWIGDKQYWIYG